MISLFTPTVKTVRCSLRVVSTALLLIVALSNLTISNLQAQCPVAKSSSGDLVICGTKAVNFWAAFTGITTQNVKFVYFTAATTNPYGTPAGTLGTVANASLSNSKTTANLTNITLPGNGVYYVYAILDPLPADVACRPSASLVATVQPFPKLTLVNQQICPNDPNTSFDLTMAPIKTEDTGDFTYYYNTEAQAKAGGDNTVADPTDVSFGTYWVRTESEFCIYYAPVKIEKSVPKFGSYINQSSCVNGVAKPNATIGLSSWLLNTQKYDLVQAATYTGTATFATAKAIPSNGKLDSTLVNPTVDTPYTIRIFSDGGCTKDTTLILKPRVCTVQPPNCTNFTFSTAIVPATCKADGTANTNGLIQVTRYVVGAKFDIVANATYNGTATFATAKAIPTSGKLDSTLANPAADKVYTVRFFGSNGCTKDTTLTLKAITCSVQPPNCTNFTFSTAIVPATCKADGTANSNGLIQVTKYIVGAKFDIVANATYNGTATFATAKAIPTSGKLDSTLVNPAADKVYTVRFFASNGCTKDTTLTLKAVKCSVQPPNCTSFTFSTAIVPATCKADGTANANGLIQVTRYVVGAKFDIVANATYNGTATFATAKAIPTSGKLDSTLANPATDKVYTVRFFGSNGCTKDTTLTLKAITCSTPPLNCATITIQDKADTLCSGYYGESVFATNSSASDTLRFVYFTTPKTGNTMYTGGTLIANAPSAGSAGAPNGLPGLSLPANNGTTPVNYYVYAILKKTQKKVACRPFAEKIYTVLPLPSFVMDSIPACNGETTYKVNLKINSAGTYKVLVASSVSTVGSGVVPSGISQTLTNIAGGATTVLTLNVNAPNFIVIEDVNGCSQFKVAPKASFRNCVVPCVPVCIPSTFQIIK